MIQRFLFFFISIIGISLSANQRPIIVLETTQGNIHLQLFPEVAPKACENFISLIQKGYYKETVFHRVIKDFMVQGGDPSGLGVGGESIWGQPFEDEIAENLSFDRPGLLAMANRGPNTNGSQFFITTTLTPWLNKRHTIFGEIIKGYEIIEKINKVKTDSRDRPLAPQKILNAYSLRED